MAKRRHSRYATWAVCMLGGLLAVYLAAAYLILPAVWFRHEHQPGLAARSMVTATAEGIPGDPLNVGLVGSRDEVVGALAKAGWHAADAITLRSSVEIGVSVLLSRAYPAAPVSSLFYEGRRQDLAFEKPAGRSPASRHHVRLWLTEPRSAEGREVWLGSASFDRAVGFSHDTGQITHHIDPDLDAERAYLISSLATEGVLARTYLVPGIGPTLNGRNGEGDRYFTDGDVAMGVIHPRLDAPIPAAEGTPAGADRSAKRWLWNKIVAVGRALRLVPPQRNGAE